MTHAFLAPAKQGVNLTRYGRELAAGIMNSGKEVSSGDKIRQGVAPDLIEIEVKPEKVKISINQIKDIKKSASRSPVSSNKKVYLINKAEDLSLEAANSLLKILEEPPDYLLFILLSYNPSEVPATVTSRCRRLPKGGFSEKDLKETISQFGKNDEEASYLIEVVDGREDLLEELDLKNGEQLDRGLDFRKKLSEKDLGSASKIISESDDLVEKHEATRKIFREICKKGEFELLELAEELSKMEDWKLSDFLSKGIHMYRKKLFSSLEDDGSKKTDFKIDNTSLACLNDALRDLSSNVNRRLLLENLFLCVKEG